MHVLPSTTTTFLLVSLLLLLTRNAADAASYSEKTAWRALHFSKAAYCNKSFVESWSCGDGCSEHKDFTLANVFYDSDLETLGYVGVDNANSQVVAAFRGTSNLINLALDAVFVREAYDDHPCPGCELHTGFHVAYGSLQSEVRRAVDTLLADNPSHSLFVTGHSLGGAMATLAAVDFAARMRSGETPSRPVHCYSLASPRIGNAAWAAWAEGLLWAPGNEHHRITHSHDPVIHLPTTALGFVHVASEIYYPGEDTESVESAYVDCQDVGTAEDPSCGGSVFGSSVGDHTSLMGICTSCGCSAREVQTVNDGALRWVTKCGTLKDTEVRL